VRKYIFFTLIISILYSENIVSCLQEFSPDDKRPFFEQYKIEINSQSQEKDRS